MATVKCTVLYSSRPPKAAWKVTLFYENGSLVRATSVDNQPVSVRQQNAKFAKNIAAVRDSVLENEQQSFPHRA